MSTLLQDLRYGARMLARNPGFTAVVVLTLALGIAANTSIFSVVNAFLLRPLPFDEPARLVHLWQTDQSRGWRQLRVSVPNFEDWRERSQVFEDMAGYYYGSVSLLEEEGPARVQVGNVTPNLFRVLGVEPLLGRGFEPEENRPGRQKVVVLKHSFWLRHFAGQDSVLGESLTLDAVPYTIIGVMPPTFEFSMKATQMWRPLVLDRFRDDREANGPLLVVGRIKPELNREQAQAEMTTLARTLEQEHPVANAGKGVNIVPLREALIFFYDLVQLMFLTLFLAVGFVLLIICANIGNLLLARAVARTQEVAVRTALGASRARLLQQFLTEGLLLALLGGAAGAALAYLLVGSAAPVIPQDLYRVGEISLDTRALLFTLGASLFSVLLFGLAPALHVSRPNLAAALKEGARGASAGTRGKRLRQGLVVSEIALAVVLLVGSLLMVQSFIRLQRVETGFDTDRMLTMEIILPTSKYKNDTEENIFYDEVLRRAAALPGVEAAAGVYPLPLNFESLSKEFLLPGGTPTKPGEKLFANNFWVTPGYFRAMGIALRRGRDFAPADNAAARRVVVINRKMAERYWPNRSPVGRRLQLEAPAGGYQEAEIIGVVENSKHFLLNEGDVPLLYLPQLQESTRRRFLTLRAAEDPLSLVASVRREVWTVDPALPITAVRSLEQVVGESLAPWSGGTATLAVLGSGALLLAAMGLYGVIAFFGSQRAHEISIRMALGAQAKDILWLVIRQGLSLTSVGLLLGLAAALALTRVMQSLLFGVSSADPVTLVAAPLLLGLVALLACYVPARRATRVDPMAALRYE